MFVEYPVPDMANFFIRYNVAREICARIEYLDQSVEKASSELIQELKERGVDGGVIFLDANGNASMVFNTGGMARAYKNSKGDEIVKILLNFIIYSIHSLNN
ncbi:MAG: hypothetical protein Ct9H300mP4_16300 [Gammaproteobacteria bacterium]|nr:MAG: hypothetical protein Ct9H300mP4_16300 [Gammaproteobacteria bacterium]